MKSKLLKVISSISLIVFLFPFFTVSCANEKVSINGMNLAFGKTIMNQRANGNILMILLFLLPLALLVIVLKRLVEYETIAAIISGGTGLLLLIYAKVVINERAEQSYAEVSTGIGYYLMFLLNLSIIGIIVYDYWIKNKTALISKIQHPDQSDNNDQTLLESAKYFTQDYLNWNDKGAQENTKTEKVSTSLADSTGNKSIEVESVKSTLQPNKYIDIECPLMRLGDELITVYRNEHIAEAKIKICLQNKANNDIQAIEFKVKMFNYFDEEIPEFTFSHIESQIIMDKHKKAFVFIPICVDQLQHVGYIEAEMRRLRYMNGQQWETNERKVAITIGAQDLNLYRRYFGIDAICYPVLSTDNWLCVCGNQNVADTKVCVLCGRQLNEVMLTKEEIEEKLQIEIPLDASLSEIRECVISYKHKLSTEKFEQIIKEIDSKLEVIKFYGNRQANEQRAREIIISLLNE